MLAKFFKRVPAATIVVPMIFAALINTLGPNILEIGPMTAALTSKEGLNALIDVTLVAVGSQLTIKRLKLAIHRGLVLFLAKWLTAIVLGFLFFKVFGREGFLGISALAFVAAISNHNNSIFIGLIGDYGDEYDMASAAITAIISVPIFTFLTLSMLGIADITPTSILDLAFPILVGIFLGNIDKNFCSFLAGTQKYIMPFLGFAIGAGINLGAIFKGGPAGVVLSILTVGASFLISLPADIFINKRQGWAAISTYTAAGNSVIVPALVANLDKSWQAYESLAAAQLGTVVIISSLLVPFVAGLWKKLGKRKVR
ncbi:2-keto-3-deoxygluconate permease [uncultured Anaerococcus sp.]|uniref:2-keto-3-deoxygluconate permease n=1 Tax=uncultured Anaerococcus sp. TaxID=293428 RepID=UPI00288BC025|nr:2-keto-3-deoxygluconate permease [uncultured Anaerococcus sp.]